MLPVQAFKPGNVDLPSDGTVAAVHTITLPDNYNDIEFLGALTHSRVRPLLHPSPQIRLICTFDAPEAPVLNEPGASRRGNGGPISNVQQLHACSLDPSDPEAPVRFTMGHRDSFMLADDISALLGSQTSLDGGARPDCPFFADSAHIN